jgi:hypothetical protein
MGFITGMRAVRSGSEESKRCEITKVENGWIVTVYNEPDTTDAASKFAETLKGMATIVPMINKMSRRAAEEEMEPWKAGNDDDDDDDDDDEDGDDEDDGKGDVEDKVKEAIEQAFGPSDKKEVKPVEVHVFLDHAKMLEFVGNFIK